MKKRLFRNYCAESKCKRILRFIPHSLRLIKSDLLQFYPYVFKHLVQRFSIMTKGNGSVVGGNVFLTHSVRSGTRVAAATPAPVMKNPSDPFVYTI